MAGTVQGPASGCNELKTADADILKSQDRLVSCMYEEEQWQ